MDYIKTPSKYYKKDNTKQPKLTKMTLHTMTSPKSTGMLEVGKHCEFCRQIDFLPFYCSSCKGCFCSEHRTREHHHCQKLLEEIAEKNSTQQKTKNNNGQYFKSLLPKPGYIRVAQHQTDSVTKEKSTIKTKLVSKGNVTALGKLKHFFEKMKSKTNSGSSSSKIKKMTPSGKLIVISKMKQSAKGDPKIPQNNRIYCYVYLILGEANTNEKLPLKHEFFINKVWPVGRVIDYLATQLDIKNMNLSDVASKDEKLFLYLGEDINSKLLNSNERVLGSIKDGDTVYLVRGLPN